MELDRSAGHVASAVKNAVQDASIALVVNSRIAATAFGKGYSEHNAMCAERRAKKAAEREARLRSLKDEEPSSMVLHA